MLLFGAIDVCVQVNFPYGVFLAVFSFCCSYCLCYCTLNRCSLSDLQIPIYSTLLCIALHCLSLLKKKQSLFPKKKKKKNCIQRRSSRLFTIFSLCRVLSPTLTLKWPRHNRVKITCNTSSAYHVQHVVCHLVRRDSSSIKFDRVEIAFNLALLYGLKPLTDEGGEETRIPGENP